jgi:NADH-quinone oxidoreductase subunit N
VPIPPPELDLIAIGPILVTAVTAMVALMLELVLKGKQKDGIAYVSLLGVLLAALSALPLWNAGRPPAYGGMVLADNLTVFVTLVILAVAAITLLMAPAFLARTGMNHGEFHALLLLAVCGGVMLAASGDLIVLFLGLELLSISLYIMAGFARGQLRSEEAALKYFLLGSFSIGFFIYGSALIYGATGTTDLAGVGKAIAALGQQENPLLLIGMGLLLVGFGFKLALVPFHQWTPDVYDGSPTLVTAFMSVATKAAVFAALIRVLAEALPGIRADWSTIVWVLAAATMLLGNIVAISQTEIKRLLAYSSIGQAGYVMTAIYGGGPDGWSATLFYLLCYAVMNLGAFGVVMAVGLRGEANRRTEDFAGLFQRQPFLAVAMTIFMLSLAGIPPTAGFWAKFYTFGAAIKAGNAGLALAIIGVVSSVIAAYYYLRVAITLYRAPETAEARPSPAPVPVTFMAAVVIALLLTVQIGLYPNAELAAAQQAAPGIARVAAR